MIDKNKIISFISIALIMISAMVLLALFDLKISTNIFNSDIRNETQWFRDIFNSIGYNILAVAIFFMLSMMCQKILITKMIYKNLFYWFTQIIVLIISMIIALFKIIEQYNDLEMNRENIILIVLTGIYLAFFISYIIWFNFNKKYNVIFIETMFMRSIRLLIFLVIGFIAVNSMKYIFGRNRPINVLEDNQKFYYPFEINFDDTRGLSFPSGHTISAISILGLLILVKKQDYKRVLLILLVIVIAWGVAISRVLSLAHFTTDVTMAIEIGIIAYWVSINTFKYKELTFNI